jgi:hypothetical protein
LQGTSPRASAQIGKESMKIPKGRLSL